MVSFPVLGPDIVMYSLLFFSPYQVLQCDRVQIWSLSAVSSMGTALVL